MTAPYARAEGARDRLDEQITAAAANVQWLVEELVTDAAELRRLAAAGARLGAQAGKLADRIQGVVRGAERHDVLTSAVRTVYGKAVYEEAATVVLPTVEPPSAGQTEPFRGDHVIRLTREQLQDKLRVLNNDAPGMEGTAK
ncbi:hypothetical protein [Streptomyces subrutilus]|uniref:Uncharacterized protein n=1 Tax=Streptomyces subrutilus TaxID=36818 RepID=A0A1E5NXU2_9ACTN|nr:hypothetical protein [Streptomyces subrutilus]OEJ20942.1 hypothetical protein BGK67_35500 [Streptomyces subrutilus]